uniref:Ig-like domain-containing protein n=1 Tax=Mangrovicoccus sp. HB161399 TaxID=2720392 RepID=UPI0015562844
LSSLVLSRAESVQLVRQIGSTVWTADRGILGSQGIFGKTAGATYGATREDMGVVYAAGNALVLASKSLQYEGAQDYVEGEFNTFLRDFTGDERVFYPGAIGTITQQADQGSFAGNNLTTGVALKGTGENYMVSNTAWDIRDYDDTAAMLAVLPNAVAGVKGYPRTRAEVIAMATPADPNIWRGAIGAMDMTTGEWLSGGPAPAVFNSTPANGDLYVLQDTTLAVEWDRKVALVGTPTLTYSGGSVAFTTDVRGNTIYVTPNADLAYETEYTLTFPAGSVEASYGTGNAAASISFTSRPDVFSYADSLINTSVETSVWDSKTVDADGYWINTSLASASADSNSGEHDRLTAGNYTLCVDILDADPVDSGFGIITVSFNDFGISNNGLTYNCQSHVLYPHANFVASGIIPLTGGGLRLWGHLPVSGSGDSRVLVTIGSGASAQSTGYRRPALFSGYASEADLISLGDAGTPVEAAPAIVSTYPADGQTIIPVGAAISIVYDQAITLVGTPTLVDGSSNPVAFTASVSGSTLTITPDADMAFDSAHTVTLPLGLVQSAGGTDSAAASFTFTTTVDGFTYAQSLVATDLSAAAWGSQTPDGEGWVPL